MGEDFKIIIDNEEDLLTAEGELQANASKTEVDPSSLPQELLQDSGMESTPEQSQQISQKIGHLSVPQKIRLATLGNRPTRNTLIRDPNKVIALAVLRSPKITENEVIGYALQKNLHEEVLQEIARHKIWIKNYQIKLAVVSNPKTPLATAMKFLDHLHDRDLQSLSRNKNISSVLARTAGRTLIKRKG